MVGSPTLHLPLSPLPDPSHHSTTTESIDQYPETPNTPCPRAVPSHQTLPKSHPSQGATELQNQSPKYQGNPNQDAGESPTNPRSCSQPALSTQHSVSLYTAAQFQGTVAAVPSTCSPRPAQPRALRRMRLVHCSGCVVSFRSGVQSNDESRGNAKHRGS
jgi:hypothetical protein